MRIVWLIIGVAVIVTVLVDAFETILQPRRVTHRFRFARLFYRSAWRLWRTLAPMFSSSRKREAFLSGFGPASLLALFALWMCGLVVGFGLLHWSLRTPLLM